MCELMNKVGLRLTGSKWVDGFKMISLLPTIHGSDLHNVSYSQRLIIWAIIPGSNVTFITPRPVVRKTFSAVFDLQLI